MLNPDGDWRESGLDPVAVRQLNVRPSVVIDVQGKFDFSGPLIISTVVTSGRLDFWFFISLPASAFAQHYR